ncbi:MAG: LysR family transcriptional regulator [Rhodocyclales bacterium]|nr:LysR family transcriptional regulator [Rhodocyclales bacterium]
MHDALPNLRHLRAFCEAERQKSISRAADAVFLSQPAVTQAIAKLEKTFGVGLLERVGAGVSPTGAGSAYANRVRRALAVIESGIAEALRIGGARSLRQARDLLALLTTTQLRAFVAVGTTNNFTLAARLVGSSQPAVHRSTRELEAVLEVALFEKTTRGIVLTRAGQVLWQQLKLAFAELHQGMAEVKSSGGLAQGSIVVGCMPLARHFVMPDTLVQFCGQYPAVDIQFIESPYPDLLHGLRHGEIDFLVGALRYPPPVDDILQESLFASALCIVAGSQHPLARVERPLSLADLAAYPWVLPPSGTPTRDRFERLIAGVPGGGRFGLIESSSQILVRGLLKGSERLTLISRQQVQYEVDMGDLVILDFELGDNLREIGLTFRSDWQPTRVQLEFLELLRWVAAGAARPMQPPFHQYGRCA